jgi:hypothetical protein
MTVSEALAIARTVRPNELDEQILRRLLIGLDHRIARQTGKARVGEHSPVYREALIVPAPFDWLYWAYLVAMIDMAMGNTEKYSISYALFNDAYNDYVRWVQRGEGSR